LLRVLREYRLGNPRRAAARGYGVVISERAVLDAEDKAGGWRFVKVEVLALIGVLVPSAPALAQTTFATGRAPMLETGSQKPMPLEWIDKDTGHRMIRLSRREGSNASFYFHNNPFVPQLAGEGDKMVFYGTASNRRQLFAVNLKTLKVEQLTDHRGNIFGEIVAPRRREVFYQSGDSVFATHVDSGRTRLIYVFPT